MAVIARQGMPCGEEEGQEERLPIGLMLVGRHFDEAVVLRAARAYEQCVG
jgi:Asp-tRNA(Asn)/Glu-tRNA(Gln) amidotransferase A subunit family amidase